MEIIKKIGLYEGNSFIFCRIFFLLNINLIKRVGLHAKNQRSEIQLNYIQFSIFNYKKKKRAHKKIAWNKLNFLILLLTILRLQLWIRSWLIKLLLEKNFDAFFISQREWRRILIFLSPCQLFNKKNNISKFTYIYILHKLVNIVPII